MANPESASGAQEAQQQVSEKRLFLSQKRERNDDLVQTIQELEGRIGKLDRDIIETDEKLAQENDSL
ncbi:hypothetical protein H6768_00305 [Candidatus Peribacteria bacterium]|nr:hypothetical protein [Candidatus Peribacteria bacterium]